MELKDYVRNIPNFPKEGVQFKDITTVLQDPTGLRLAITDMQKSLVDLDFDIVVAPESRGFIFGVPIAFNTRTAFVPVRKKGKLPYETISETYELEYGTATIEIHKDAIKAGQRVVIVDDLLATGGTLQAIINLVERLGGEVVKICCLIELSELNGRELLKGYDISSSIMY
jgi:adenine phosphoribosyltransferase